MSERAAKLVHSIVNAKDDKAAIAVLQQVMDELYISPKYLELKKTQDQLIDKTQEFNELTLRYRELVFPKTYEDVHAIRVDCNFLYRDISDQFAFVINMSKVSYEERKTVQRAQSSLELKSDKEFQMQFKNLSETLVRDYIGASKTYNEWTHCYATAYGNYKALENLLMSVRQFADSLASEEKYILQTLVKDVK